MHIRSLPVPEVGRDIIEMSEYILVNIEVGEGHTASHYRVNGLTDY